MSYMKRLSKCPYFKKTLLLWKILGCTPVDVREKAKMAGINKMGRKALFSLWSPNRETNKKYLVLPMEGGCGFKDNDNSDNSKFVINIKITLVTMITIAIRK